MKTKIKILIVSFVMAAAAVTGFNMAQNSNNIDVSLADIAVMAKAGSESNPCPGWDGSAYCQYDPDLKDCAELEECGSSCSDC